MKTYHFLQGALAVGVFVAFLGSAAIVTKVAAAHAKRTSPDVARKSDSPMPVSLYTVGEREVVERLVVLGTLSPDRKPSIYAMVEAGVKGVLVSDGDLVEEGQVLVLLDPTEYEARLASARKEAKIMRDLYESAQEAWKRKQGLLARQATSLTEMEKAEKALGTAELDLEQVEAEVARFEAQVTACTVRAPARGIVRDVIDRGWTRATPATELVKFEAIDPLWAEGSVHESYLPMLTPEMPVEVTVPALPGEKFTAYLGPGIPPLDPKTRTGTVRVRLDVKDARLLPGMTAQVRFSFKGKGETAPRISLFNRLGREASLFRVKDGVAELTTVVLGRMDADWAEIVDGINPNDVIVQSGHLYLHNGDRVAEAH